MALGNVMHDTAARASPAQAAEPSFDNSDYDAICAAMAESARGRWFLGEYARRNRSADTIAVLAAIDRIGATLRGEALPPTAPEYLHLGLMAMAGLVAAVEADMSALSTGHETADGKKPRVARVVSTLRDLGDCIQVMLDGWKSPEAKAHEPPRAPLPPLALVETPVATTEPAAAETPALAETATAEHAVADHETDFVPFEFEAAEEITATALTLPPADIFSAPQEAEPAPDGIMETPGDPLAPLRALSRAETIALFT